MITMRRGGRRDDGYTFVELLVVTALVAILASAVMPLARVAAQRQREIELRRTLRELRALYAGLIDPTQALEVAA